MTMKKRGNAITKDCIYIVQELVFTIIVDMIFYIKYNLHYYRIECEFWFDTASNAKVSVVCCNDKCLFFWLTFVVLL